MASVVHEHASIACSLNVLILLVNGELNASVCNLWTWMQVSVTLVTLTLNLRQTEVYDKYFHISYLPPSLKIQLSQHQPHLATNMKQHIKSMHPRHKCKLVHSLELWTYFKFQIVNYERDLVHFKLCELNFDLALVKCERASHWQWLSKVT